MVEADTDRWVMVPTFEPFVAYHQDDIEVWYRSSTACRAALEDGEAARGGC